MKTPIYVTGTPEEPVVELLRSESESVEIVEGSSVRCPYCGRVIHVVIVSPYNVGNDGFEFNEMPCVHVTAFEFPRQTGIDVHGDKYQPIRIRYEWQPDTDKMQGTDGMREYRGDDSLQTDGCETVWLIRQR